MVVKCLVDCSCQVDSLREEFTEGKLYDVVIENNSSFIIGNFGNKFPIIGFWHNFKVCKPHKRKSRYK